MFVSAFSDHQLAMMKGLPMPEPRLMCSICSFQPKKKERAED
jgi:hypothetical protein